MLHDDFIEPQLISFINGGHLCPDFLGLNAGFLPHYDQVIQEVGAFAVDLVPVADGGF